jgi:hypothetical protein
MFSLLSRTFVIPKFGIPEPTVWRFFSQSNTRYTAPLHEDPEARRKRLDKRNERQRQKYRNDPEYREREIARHPIKDPMRRNQTKQYMRLANKNWRAQNPEAYKKSREKGLLRDVRRYANDPRFPFLKCLSLLARYAWFREELPWKAHKPVLYEEKVPKQCAGLKLWYVYQGNDTRYDAARCRESSATSQGITMS